MPKHKRTALQRQIASAQQRERYRANLDENRRYRRAAIAKIREARIPIINQIKMDSGCVDCGYREHPGALQFDHIDPTTKLFGIAKGLSYSWPMILAEMAKCQVRCANCHAVRSIREGHLGRPRIASDAPGRADTVDDWGLFAVDDVEGEASAA